MLCRMDEVRPYSFCSKGAWYFSVLIFLLPLIAVPAPRAVWIFLILFALPCVPAIVRAWPLFCLSLKTHAPVLIMGVMLWGYGLWVSPIPDRAMSFGLLGGVIILLSLILIWHVQFFNEVHIKRMFKALTIGCGLCLVLVLIDYNFKQPITAGVAHLMGQEKPPLYVLDRTLVLLSLFYWVLIAFYRPSHWMVGITAFAAILGLTHTSSQAATLAMPTGLIVYIMMTLMPRLMRPLLWFGLVIVFFTAPFMVLLITYFADQAKEAIGLMWQMSNADIRLNIWRLTTISMLDHPWLGQGIEAAFALKRMLHPHNGILQIWIEFGLVGICFVFACVQRVFEKICATPALMAVFFAWLSIFCVSYSIWPAWWIATAGVVSFLSACFLRLEMYQNSSARLNVAHAMNT